MRQRTCLFCGLLICKSDCYSGSEKHKIYLLMPGKSITEGLFYVWCDDDLQKMMSTVPKNCNNIILYVDQMFEIPVNICNDVAIEEKVLEVKKTL